MPPQRILAALKICALVALVAGLVIEASPEPAKAAFPGANGKIAFESTRDGNGEVYVVNGDGSGLTNLTQSPANEGGPAWSPDGSKIAFSSDRDGGGLFVMNGDGSGVTRLNNTTPYDCCPAWSPDGLKLAFTSYRDDADPTQCGSPPCSVDIYTMDADGGGVTRLTTDPGRDTDPAWSPDGSKIAFHVGRADDTCGVFVMNPDGSDQADLTAGQPRCSEHPAWSPDGTKIAFTRFLGSSQDIFVMDADGTNQTRLTTSSIAYEHAPAWSPDGTKIAYVTIFGPVRGLAVMNADGSRQAQLTAESDRFPDWQPLIAELPATPTAPISATATAAVVLATPPDPASVAALPSTGGRSSAGGGTMMWPIATLAGAGALALGGAAWYARRRLTR